MPDVVKKDDKNCHFSVALSFARAPHCEDFRGIGHPGNTVRDQKGRRELRIARAFRHVSWRVRSVTLDRQLTASSTVIPLPSPSEFGPSASVRLGMVRTSRTSSAAQGRGVETSHMRLKTCTSLGWCCGTSHPRGRAPSAPRPGSVGRGRGWWRLRDGKGHPDHSFLLIDVDRTGSAQSCPALALRQAQIRLPRRGRGPSAFALATGPLAPVPGDPHRNKERPK